MIDREMMKALEADGEKVRQLTGEYHGPIFLCEDSWPAVLPSDVIAACVGGGITCEQVTRIYSLLRASFQLRQITGSALSSHNSQTQGE